ncbi:MAG: energy-coupling factor transporter transmembrane component T [Eubacteriales bacterium]|nr:energy-coupling factor transporter transmembrane component T [Eubacteriales bacterium]
MERFKLDPRTKLILLFIMGTAIFSYMPPRIVGLYIFIAFGLLLLCKHYKRVLVYLIIYCLVEVIMFKGMVNLFTLLFPLFVYGRYLVLTTSIAEFSLALQKMKVPLGFQIIVLVMIRYFPTIKVTSKSIFNAMRLRGVHFSPVGFLRHPVKTVEYLYVPLVYSLIKTGDELTVAALTRGLGLYDTRTFLTEIGFRLSDVLMVLVYLGIMILGIFMKGGVL